MESIVRQLSGTVFDLIILKAGDGFASLAITGKDVQKLLANESGGHRWQRVPPTENKGRVHTSTITVFVTDENTKTSADILDRELVWDFYRGKGPGGQHKNKTNSAARVRHIPTGIVACADGRSQAQNKVDALAELKRRISELAHSGANQKLNSERKESIGSGMRGDKIRTVRVQDDTVICHITGKRIRYKDYCNGMIPGLTR